MSLVQELTPMSPDQLEAMHNTEGKIMKFKGGYGYVVMPNSKGISKKVQIARKKGLERGLKSRIKMFSVMESGKFYTSEKLHEMTMMYKNHETAKNTFNRLAREGYINLKTIDGVRHFGLK